MCWSLKFFSFVRVTVTVAALFVGCQFQCTYIYFTESIENVVLKIRWTCGMSVKYILFFVPFNLVFSALFLLAFVPIWHIRICAYIIRLSSNRCVILFVWRILYIRCHIFAVDRTTLPLSKEQKTSHFSQEKHFYCYFICYWAKFNEIAVIEGEQTLITSKIFSLRCQFANTSKSKIERHTKDLRKPLKWKDDETKIISHQE